MTSTARDRLTRLWSIPDNPPSMPDCFVIPSYGLRDRTLPTQPTRAQIELAVAWWRKFPHAILIMSTGDNQGLGITSARVMIEYAATLGVPRANLIEEHRSRNTLENLLYSSEIIQRGHFRQATLVTLDLYTRRAVATARKLGWQNFYWLSVYSDAEPAYGFRRFQTYSRLTIFCYEIAAVAYGKMAGWV